MDDKTEDWRLQGQEKYLRGVTLFLKPYEARSPEWDHDHCEFCGSKFSLTEKGAFVSGYTTRDNYHWICPTCFSDLKKMFQWNISD